jgi:hypothetical protein
LSTFIFRIWCNCCIFSTWWCIDVLSWTNKSRLVHNRSYWHLFESLKNETKLQRRKPRPSFFNYCWIRFGNCSPKVIHLFQATHIRVDKLRISRFLFLFLIDKKHLWINPKDWTCSFPRFLATKKVHSLKFTFRSLSTQ